MAFTKVVGAGIHTLSNIASHNINSSGIITATKFVGPFDGSSGDFSGNVTIDGNLTVNGTTSTIDTNLIGVDKIEVTTAGTNVAVAVTHNGTGDLVRLYDGTSQKVTVDDEGKVGIGTIPASGTTLDIDASGGGVLVLRRNSVNTSNKISLSHDGTHGTLDSTNDILFRAGGDERLRINSSGELISTNGTLRRNVSDSSFTVSGDSASNTGANINLYGASHGSLANVFRVRVATSEKFRINSSGDVCIGGADSDIGNKLNVVESSGNAGILLASSTVSASGYADFTFAPSNTVAGGRIRVEAEEDFSTAANRTANMQFYTRKDGSFDERLRIKSDGTINIVTQNGALEWTASSGSNPFIRSIGAGQTALEFNTGGNEALRIAHGDLLLGGHGTRIFDDSSGANVVVDIYGGTTAGKRGILALGGRVGDDNGDIGTIQFLNENNSVGTAANHNQSKLVASIDAKSETTDSNASADSGGHLLFSTKPETGQLAERVKVSSTGAITSTQTTPVITIKGTNANANSHASVLFQLRDGNSNDYDIARVFGQTDASNGGYGKILVQTAFNNALYTRIQIDKDGAVQIGQKGGATDLPAATSALNVRAMTDGNLHVRPSTDLQGGTTGVALDVLNNASNALKDLILRGQTIIFRNSAESLRISSGGQIGVKKSSPKEWNTSYKSLQIYDAGYIAGSTDDSFVAIGANNYLATDGNYKYTNTDHTSQLYQVDGTLVFRNAGAAGNDSVVSWTERFNIASTGAASFTGNATGAITHQFYNSNSGSGADTRVLIKTYANQGADPYIKFDSGGSNMIVGQLYAGTTNNKLVLGTGESPSGGVNGIHINGSGQVQIPTNGQQLTFGSSQQIKFYYENSEERMYLQGDGAYGMAFRVNSGNRIEISKSTGDVTMQGSSGRNFLWDNSEYSLYLTDNGSGASARLKIGTGGDLQLYHDVGGANHINAANNAEIKISSNSVTFYDYTGVTKRAVIDSDGLRTGGVAAPTLATTGKQPMIMRNATYFTKEIHRTISDYRSICDGAHYGYLLLIPAYPGSGNVSAKKFYGTISCDRGGTGSGNSTQVSTVHASTAYNDDQFYVENARNSQYVVSAARVTYGGTIYLALKFGQSGGGPHNGIHIDGQYTGADSNFLKLVRLNELDSVQNDTHGAIANHNAQYPICGVMVVDMDGTDMNDNSIRYMRGGTIHFEYSPAGTDCYDNGVFTAQVNGIYHVTCGFLTGNNVGRVEAAIQRKVTGGSFQNVINLNGAGDFSNSHNGPTGTAFVKMKAGWQLRFYRVSSNQGVYGAAHANNYFGAVLMHGLMETQV